MHDPCSPGRPDQAGTVTAGPGSTVHRYPAEVLGGDVARAVAGLVVTAGPLVLVPVHSGIAAGLGLAGGVFAWFLVATVIRQRWEFRIDEAGVTRSGPFGDTRLDWSNLRRMRLFHYATRRSHDEGWMELTLKGPAVRLHVMSTLPGFDRLVARAAAAAAANDLALDDATAGNLAALGLLPDHRHGTDGSWFAPTAPKA